MTAAPDEEYEGRLSFYRKAVGSDQSVREWRPVGRTGGLIMTMDLDARSSTHPPSGSLTLAMVLNHDTQSRIDLGAGRFHVPAVPRGTFTLAAPNAPVSIAAEAAHQWQLLNLPWDRLRGLADADDLLPAGGDFGPLHATSRLDDRVIRIMNSLWTEAQAGGQYGALLTDGLILQLVAELSRLKSGDEAVRARRPDDRRVRRAMEYLEAHLAEDVGLEELASVTGLSTRHISSAFRDATGLPPHRWLMCRRIKRACALLLDPGFTITEIAFACGFSSSQHFATRFLQKMKCTPSAYRLGTA